MDMSWYVHWWLTSSVTAGYPFNWERSWVMASLFSFSVRATTMICFNSGMRREKERKKESRNVNFYPILGFCGVSTFGIFWFKRRPQPPSLTRCSPCLSASRCQRMHSSMSYFGPGNAMKRGRWWSRHLLFTWLHPFWKIMPVDAYTRLSWIRSVLYCIDGRIVYPYRHNHPHGRFL